jgi:hypothetical protein
MSATPEASASTRTFARVIGPFLVIVAAGVAVRVPDMAMILSAFFENPALVWITGNMMVLAALVIIAGHPYWSGPAAVFVSLFGWYVGLKGLTLLLAPQLIARAGAAAIKMPAMPLVWLSCGVFVLIGLWLSFAGWIAKPAE